jgi:hypothetical protein
MVNKMAFNWKAFEELASNDAHVRQVAAILAIREMTPADIRDLAAHLQCWEWPIAKALREELIAATGGTDD